MRKIRLLRFVRKDARATPSLDASPTPACARAPCPVFLRAPRPLVPAACPLSVSHGLQVRTPVWSAEAHAQREIPPVARGRALCAP